MSLSQHVGLHHLIHQVNIIDSNAEDSSLNAQIC